MSRVARSIDIAASPDAVWTVLADVEHWPRWAACYAQHPRTESAAAGAIAADIAQGTLECEAGKFSGIVLVCAACAQVAIDRLNVSPTGRPR